MTDQAARVLVIEDEADLAELIAINLEQAGFSVETIGTGTEAANTLMPLLDELASKGACDRLPDVVLLDLMLPGVRGEELLRRVRAHPVGHRLPVIVLTAKGSDHDQVVGLDLGADDYLPKPVAAELLVARICALLRRTQRTEQPERVLREGPVEINLETHEVTLDAEPIRLTLTEFRLLASLIEARGKVLSRAELMNRAMGPGITVTERTIDVHITSVRKKLGHASEMIKTVRGVGYRLMSPTASGSGA